MLEGKRYFRSKNKYAIDNEPKLLMKKICYNLEVAININGEINPINTVYVIKSTDENYSLQYILAILNSSIMNFYARNKYRTTHMRGGFIELRVFEVQQLPICNIDQNNPDQIRLYSEVISIANALVEAKKQLQQAKTESDKEYFERKCSSIDNQIDQLVYQLYGLTEEEIKIVEGN